MRRRRGMRCSPSACPASCRIFIASWRHCCALRCAGSCARAVQLQGTPHALLRLSRGSSRRRRRRHSRRARRRGRRRRASRTQRRLRRCRFLALRRSRRCRDRRRARRREACRSSRHPQQQPPPLRLRLQQRMRWLLGRRGRGLAAWDSSFRRRRCVRARRCSPRGRRAARCTWARPRWGPAMCQCRRYAAAAGALAAMVFRTTSANASGTASAGHRSRAARRTPARRCRRRRRRCRRRLRWRRALWTRRRERAAERFSWSRCPPRPRARRRRSGGDRLMDEQLRVGEF